MEVNPEELLTFEAYKYPIGEKRSVTLGYNEEFGLFSIVFEKPWTDGKHNLQASPSPCSYVVNGEAVETVIQITAESATALKLLLNHSKNVPEPRSIFERMIDGLMSFPLMRESILMIYGDLQKRIPSKLLGL